MRKVSVKKIKQNTSDKKCKLWLWVVIAFLLGGAFGYVTHYTVVNWHGFFAVCPDGVKPDKHGCCAGETYTDAGDGWMVCCPENAENCFPPIK